VYLARDDSYTYKVVLDNAGQLVTGDIVRIGGTPVGEINDIALTDDAMAEVTISVDDDLAPLHAGTTALVRATSLIGTANRYIDGSPAPNCKPELEEGAVLGTDQTKSLVELDQSFDMLDPDTRKGLDDVIHGFADWYEGQERQANQAAMYFPPALVAGRKLF